MPHPALMRWSLVILLMLVLIRLVHDEAALTMREKLDRQLIAAIEKNYQDEQTLWRLRR